jgi:hypothetical protein
MTDDRRFERTARSWLELGPTQAPERVVRAAFDEIERTGQERSLVPSWVPVFTPSSGRWTAIVALAAVAAVVAILVVLAGMGAPTPKPAPSGGPVVPPTASPGTSPSEEPTAAGSPPPSAVIGPAPSASEGGVDLTRTFTSERYGYSIGMEADWTATPATLTWTGPDNGGPVVDLIEITGTDTGITGASEALRPGETFGDWLHAFQPPGNQDPCTGGAPETWPTIRVGGEPGLWQQMCNAAEAVVEHNGRAYVFAWGNGTFDTSQHLGVPEFLETLGSVVFEAAPIPTMPPAPALPNTFTSRRNGFSIRYPDGWETHDATGPLTVPVAPEGDPAWDTVQSPDLRLSIASRPLDPGMSDDEWARLFCMWAGTSWSPPCAEVPGAWEPVDIGSHTGWLATNGDSAGGYPAPESRMFTATVVDGGRAYQVWLEGPAERSLFDAILASMELDPASAVDATPQP